MLCLKAVLIFKVVCILRVALGQELLSHLQFVGKNKVVAAVQYPASLSPVYLYTTKYIRLVGPNPRL